MKGRPGWIGLWVLCGSLAGCGDGGSTSHGDGGHSHAGERFDLGSVEAAGLTISATQIGRIEPGRAIVVELDVKGDPKSFDVIRMWVGDESGKGVLRMRATRSEGSYHAHLDVDVEATAEARLWLEVEAGGESFRRSFDREGT